MKTKTLFRLIVLAMVVAIVILIQYGFHIYKPVSQTVTVVESVPTNNIQPVLPVAVFEKPLIETNSMVLPQTDGSVIVRGSASFTMAPVSSGPPPVMMPESEARKISSRPTTK